MAIETLEKRIVRLEDRLGQVEAVINTRPAPEATPKRGWRAFVGVDGNNPDFADVIRFGREWRFADRYVNAG